MSDKPVSIVDLINSAGVDNVKFQFLSSSMTGITSNRKRGDSTVSFATDQLTANDVAFGSGPVGLIVWIPRDAVKRVEREIWTEGTVTK